MIADAGLDSVKVLNFIINDLKAKPYIARNLRREKDLKVSSTGNRICLAGFEMLHWGKYKEGGRTRIKFFVLLSIIISLEEVILFTPGCNFSL
jgi:hypothetical protein